MLHVVVIGIDRYADPKIRNLTYATSDAQAVGALFAGRIVADQRRVTTLVDEHATRANIMHAIGEDVARAAGPEDVVIIYFAGHGSPERSAPSDDDSLYLIAHDTTYERIYSTGIDMEREVTRWLHRLRARLVVMFLDACFSGRAGGRTFGGPTHLAYRDRFRDDEPISIKDLELGLGRVIVAAADDDEVALESASLGHGFFTYHLLEVLRRPPAPAGHIGVATLYDAVAAAVREATESRQHPICNGQNRGAALPLLGARPS
ncbi:caspase family protein [Haliangium sp.]|uniref:caspase family protein n=1 Tax=Haliangium sp. TaxID=2663208 RepID=UPI003D0B9F27